MKKKPLKRVGGVAKPEDNYEDYLNYTRALKLAREAHNSLIDQPRPKFPTPPKQ